MQNSNYLKRFVVCCAAALTFASGVAPLAWGQGVTVTVSSNLSRVLGPSQSQQFQATVSGTSNASVVWSIAPQIGTISASGLYTSPALIPILQTVIVTAKSVAQSSATGTSNVIVSAISLAMAPSYVTLNPGQSQQFNGYIGGSTNLAVTWAISPQIGSISGSGVYTAPTTVVTATTVSVIATSVAQTNVSVSVPVNLKASAAPPPPPPPPSGATTLSTFSLPELFGVAWPEQPIEFRYDGGQPPVATTRMIGPNGTEVPYQWVSSCSDVTAVKGCILVRSSLPANSNYTWTLQSGVAPSAIAVNAMQINQVGPNWEIKNGLTGARIVTSAGNPSPSNLAPIQGLLLPGGAWTGVGSAPSLLYSEPAGGWAGAAGGVLRTPMYSVTGYSASITESGPLKVVITATYTFNRPRYYYSTQTINTAGIGHYTVIITMYANSKSVLIDEDSDMQFSYLLPVYAQLAPDQARYRGHDSLSSGVSSPFCGYETAGPVKGLVNGSPIVLTAQTGLSNGQALAIAGVQGLAAANGTFYVKTSGYPAGQYGLYVDAALTRPVTGAGAYAGGGIVKPAYRGWTVSPLGDAYMDLTYNNDRGAGYSCTANSYSKLLTDYPPTAHASGWYEELYNSTAGPAGPVVGFFTGRASKQVYSATGPSLPGLFSSNNHWISHKQDSGIQVDNLLRGPDGAVATQIHRNWGIFVSTQGDLLASSSHQPIGDEQNSLTGINLSRLYTYNLVYPDPPGGWSWLYLPTSSANQLVSQVRNGTALCGSVNCEYNLLYSSEGSPAGRALLDMWKGNSVSAVQTALSGSAQLAQNILHTLAAGDNHFDGTYGYYQLGLYTSPQTELLNAVIMDSNSTAAQRTTAKAALALFGSLFWDDDWFPIDNPTGESFGLGNQVEQYLQYRTQAVAAAPSQPYLSSMLPTALGYPAADLSAYFSPTGAPAGSTHYQSAFSEPLIMNYMNLALGGHASMSDPKWAAYANWELSIQTPPEPRFGNIRKGYSNGDGNTEADVRLGMLGTALNSVNPLLSENLMWAWGQSNSTTHVTEDSQFGTTLASIDTTIPQVAPVLSSINIPGYHSVERYNFGTPHETALWFINGGFYSSAGHRHADDGQVTIYAHAAPMAIDWNANLYNPETPGRFVHNSIVFDSELSHAWSADNAGLMDAQFGLQNPTNTEFAAFTNSTTSTGSFAIADGTQWNRTVRTMNFDPAFPIIHVHDTFTGPSAITGKTMTWNLMSTGPVATPVGSITPTPRFSPGCQSPAAQLPSDGTVSGLPAGINEFSFTGAIWPQHATHGIDFDVFTYSNAATQQFMIGNWGHGCHPTREAGEYQAANGTPFAEVQDILRVHDSGPFTTVFLPHRKTEAPAKTVTYQPCGIQVVIAAETTCFNDSAATFSNGTTAVLSVYDMSSQTAFGFTASGGPQEVVAAQTGTITWTLGGIESGIRSLNLPGSWTTSLPVGQTGTTYSYAYAGGAQAPAVTIVFTPQH